MFRFRKSTTFMAVLAGIAWAGLATPARADFEIRISTDGGATWAATNSEPANPPFGVLSPISVSANSGGSTLTFTASGTGNAFSSTGQSFLDLSVSGSIAPATAVNIVVETSITSVPTQPPPQTLSWSFTGGSSPLTGLTENGQGWVDAANGLYGGAIGGPGFTPGVSTGSLTTPSTGSKGFSDALAYSQTLQYTLHGTSGSQPATISTDDRNTITPGPVPAGLLLVLTGMPVMGLGAWLRRRRTEVQAA
jgi:hypothetical protein